MNDLDEISKEIAEGRLLKQIGGALFGAFISLGITSSIQTGAEHIFATEAEEWGIGFWGNHHVLRVVASLVGSSIGGFSTGSIAKVRGGIWGLLSALPTSLFWMAIGVFVVSHLFSENKGFEITFGNWAVIVILIITSIIVGYYTGSLGQKVRMEYPEIFESSRPNTVLGIKWYHWFWLFTIIHWIVLLGTFSVYQGLFLFFGTTRYAFLNEVTPALAILLVGCALCLLGLSTFKIFSLLLFSDRKGLTKGQVSLRILGWIAVVIVIVGSFQALTGYFMMP